MRKIEKIERHNTLERRMRKELNIAPVKKMSNFLNKKAKETIRSIEDINWDNIEHFEMEPSKNVPNSKIDELVGRHYSQKGYRVSIEKFGIFIAEKKDNSLLINVSNFGDSILASVAVLFPVT